MSSTTVKVSIETRERLRAVGARTAEDAIVQALDALEAERFWSDAAAAAAWRRSLAPEERAELTEREADLDRLLEAID